MSPPVAKFYESLKFLKQIKLNQSDGYIMWYWNCQNNIFNAILESWNGHRKIDLIKNRTIEGFLFLALKKKKPGEPTKNKDKGITKDKQN